MTFTGIYMRDTDHVNSFVQKVISSELIEIFRYWYEDIVDNNL